MQPAIVARERVILGSAAFNIKVTATDDGDYRASWRCSLCNQAGESAIILDKLPQHYGQGHR
jgi:hypothetical protein